MRRRSSGTGAARAAGLAAALLLAGATALHAHPGRAPAPHDLWTEWRPAPATLVLLVAVALLYARGVRAAWRRAGAGRGISRARAAAFGAGLATLAVALLSPLDLASAALFSAHMVQHLLLVLVAGPLLAAGRAELALLWALPAGARRAAASWWRRRVMLRRVVAAATRPAGAWLLHTAALWAWHTPRLYDLAARSEWAHALEHACFLGTAVLFARPLVAIRADGLGGRHLSHGTALLYLFSAAMQSGVLGALLALSRAPWYQAHLATSAPWGLMPLADQQLAGALMWGPASAAYLGALLWVAYGWLERGATPVARPRVRHA